MSLPLPRRLFPLACLPLLLCVPARAGAPLREPEKPVAPSFSILTYNIEFNQGTPDGSVKAIAKAHADVVCMQEVTPAWEKKLRAELKDQYPHMLFHTDEMAGGLAFLAKVPLREVKYIDPVAGGWFPSWIVIADTAMGPAQILNVHLRPLKDDSGSKLKGFFTVKRIHGKEIEAMSASLRADMPTIVAGDFNEDEGPAFLWLVGKGYTSALAEFDAGTDTWHGMIGGVPVTYRGDHILYGPAFHAYEAHVIKEGNSDHYPVMAVIGKAKAPATTSSPK